MNNPGKLKEDGGYSPRLDFFAECAEKFYKKSTSGAKGYLMR